MTFEEFQATRTKTADVGASIGADLGDVQSGYVYEGGTHIFDAAADSFLLVIGNGQRLSSDLTELERLLFDFWRSENLE